jgi:hypothetical protein
MRLIIKISSVLLAFVATLLVIAFFLPPHYTIEYTSEIAVNRDTCLTMLRSAQTWSIWNSDELENHSKDMHIDFNVDERLVEGGVNGKFTMKQLVQHASIDTIRVETSPVGSLIHWKSVLLCEYPLGRFSGLFYRTKWGNQVQQRLNAFQKYMDESTLGPPLQLNQEEAIKDQ